MSSTERNLDGHVKSFIRIFECECKWRELSSVERLIIVLMLVRKTFHNEVDTLSRLNYNPRTLQLLYIALTKLTDTLILSFRDHNDVNNPNN